MVAGPLADDHVAFSCSQYVSEPVSWLQVLWLIIVWCSQFVSEPISWLQVLWLIIVHVPALRK